MQRLFQGTINRLPFFCLRAISVTIFVFVAVTLLMLPYSLRYLLILIAAYIGFVFISVSLIIRRFHDINMSGFWFFAYLIPGVGIVLEIMLIFRKGDEGENAYGPAIYKKSLYGSFFNIDDEF